MPDQSMKPWQHEAFEGRCAHCDLPFRNGRPATPTQPDQTDCREAFSQAWNAAGDNEVEINFDSNATEVSMEPLAKYWFDKGYQAAHNAQAARVEELQNNIVELRDQLRKIAMSSNQADMRKIAISTLTRLMGEI